MKEFILITNCWQKVDNYFIVKLYSYIKTGEFSYRNDGAEFNAVYVSIKFFNAFSRVAITTHYLIAFYNSPSAIICSDFPFAIVRIL